MRKIILPLVAVFLMAVLVGGVNFITDSSMQLSFLPSCEKIETGASGNFLCSPDNDTTYSASYPYLALNGTLFWINRSAVQQRVETGCAAGSSIRLIDSLGNVTCETDSTGTNNYVTAGSVYTAGTSQVLDVSRDGLANITVSWTDVDTDTNDSWRVNAIDSFTANITDSCAANQKVTGVLTTGLVCDKDNNTASGVADGNATYWCVGTQTYLDGEGNCDTLDDLSDFADGGDVYEEEAHCDEHDGLYLSCNGEELDVDAAGICDYCGFADTTLTQEEVEDYAGAMVSGNTETWIAVTYEDGDGTFDFVVDQGGICTECGFSDTVRDVEFLADAVGNMTTGNTETGITVTYQDGDNTLDFVVTDSYVDTTGDVMSGDLNMSSNNVTTVDCIRFTSGGSICNA